MKTTREGRDGRLSGGSKNVNRLVDDIKKRWRRRTVIRGGLLSLLVLLLLIFVLLLVMSATFVETRYVLMAAVCIVAVTIGVVIRYVINPLRRQPSDTTIALFVEENIPALEDVFNSAVELGRDAGANAAANMLTSKLLEDATSRSLSVRPATMIDKRRDQLLIYAAGGLFFALLAFGYSVRDKIEFSRSPIELAALRPTAEITVVPGNSEVEKGSSQEIIVRTRAAMDDGILFAYKEGDGQWVQEEMTPGAATATVFLSELFDIQDPVDYFIEYNSERTEIFHLSLYEFPAVANIELAYHFPSYTGMRSTTDSGTGDIDAVVGSSVDVSIVTTGVVESAELIYSDGRSVPLTRTNGSIFTTRIAIQSDDWYHFRLLDDSGKENRFPEEYRIRALEDYPPVVRITDPSRDVKANSIEEILTAVDVEDDFGILDAQLRFTVNAGDEQGEWLVRSVGNQTKEASGEYLFFLEDYTLEPGDVISYYAEVRDHVDRDMPIATDMYFIEIVPFDKDYSQAQNPGGQQSRQGGIVFSQQQIIAATWKLYREWSSLEASEADVSLQGVIQAQANLKADIEQRINSTAFSLELRTSPEQMEVVNHLRDAVSDMEEAIKVLESSELQAAITPERKALNSLLKADAMNKEQQVANSPGGQGGGGGGVQDRISELMDLELDISKDKYETQQQQSEGEQKGQQAVDEALNKVRELAQKQEEIEQRSRESIPEGEDKKRFVDQLKREQEQLQEQTDQLSNSLQQMSKDGGQSKRMQEQSERIAENMDRAERALQDGDVEEAMKFQRRALNELEELQRGLQSESGQGARNEVNELARDFDAFREQERRLSDDIEKTADRARTGQLEDPVGALDDLQTKRQRMIENLQQLVEDAESVSESVRDEEPELASELQNIIRQIQRDGLEQNMRDSQEALRQGWLEYAERKEEQIMRTVDDIETRRRALDFSMPPSDAERLAQTIEDTRDLREQLEEIQRLSQQRSESQTGQEARQQGEGEQGQDQGQGNGNASGQGDRQQRATEARLRSEIDRARQSLDRLREGVGTDGEAQRQVEQLQSFLQRAEGTGTRLEGDQAADYFNDRAYSPLSQLEEMLVRQLDIVTLEKKLYGGRSSDVPNQYRELVDKYYESLSKQNN